MQTSAAQIAKASPPYNMKYFYSFFGIIFQFYFYFVVTEAAQYECSYRRTAHHATEFKTLVSAKDNFIENSNRNSLKPNS